MLTGRLRRDGDQQVRRLGGLGHRARLRLAGPVLTGPVSRLRVGHRVGLDNVLINTVGGFVDIGDYAFFGHGVMLLTGTHDFRERDVGRQANRPTTDRNIIIGPGAWIASRAVLVGPCTIGANAVIGCGCVVDFDVPAGTLVRFRQDITMEEIRLRVPGGAG